MNKVLGLSHIFLLPAFLSLLQIAKIQALHPYIKEEIFYRRVVKHWNRLPGEVAEAPSLETFKTRLDGALSNLV